MKRLDQWVLGEIVGPWVFGVAIFTTLIMAGTYLFQITDFIVKGINFAMVIELTLLLLPGVMAKTFPMAVLLACLLGFGRLSGDSEVVAIKAAGVNLVRVMLPVAGFGLFVAALAFGFNELLVPPAAIRATVMKQRIADQISGKSIRPTSYPIFEEGKLQAQVIAADFDFGTRTLTNATVIAYAKSGAPEYVMNAQQLRFENDRDWRIRGGATLLSADGQSFIRISDEAWPRQIPRATFAPDQVLAASVKDLDSFSMSRMAEQITAARANPQFNPRQLANLEYGYWNKISLPLAALIYALVGAPLGIRNHRTGAAAGFWMSVIIIFGYLMLANFLAIYAQGGVLPAWVASFLPLVIGLGVAAWAVRAKNN